MPNQSTATAPVISAKPRPLRRPTRSSRADHAGALCGAEVAGGERADRHGHGLRAGVAALARDDRHQDRERHHLLELRLEQADHRGGEERGDQVDEQPGEAALARCTRRCRKLSSAPTPPSALDILVGLLLDDVDDVVDGDHADQPVGLVDHRGRDQVVALEQPRHVLLVVRRLHAARLVVMMSAIGIGRFERSSRSRGTVPRRDGRGIDDEELVELVRQVSSSRM